MKPFDIELVKAGASVITRSGREARIICYDRIDAMSKGQIVALIKNSKNTWERIVSYTIDGRVATALDRDLELMIKDEQ